MRWPDCPAASFSYRSEPMSFRERLQSWRYNLVPDHLVGEILTTRSSCGSGGSYGDIGHGYDS